MSGKKAKERRDKAKKKAVAQVAESKDEENALKVKGNQYFVEKKYDEALDCYTKAIAQEEEKKSTAVHTIYSNRSATYAAKKDFAKALADAETCIKLKSDWTKGYYRKGQALEGKLEFVDALKAYNAGLVVDSKNEELKKAADSVSALIQEMKLSQVEVSSTSKDNPEKDKFEQLIDWLKEGGSKFPMIYMRYYDEDYRGVHSLCKVSADTIILEVPLKMIMTSEVAKDSDIGKKIISSGVKIRSTHSYLAAFLCQEKARGKKSFWYPYINCLPVLYRNMPIFFEEDELKWLKGSFSLKKIDDRKEDLQLEYDNICRYVPEFKQYTHHEFVWARMAVITRIFGLVINGLKTDGLVPMADMLNHKPPRDTRADNDDNHTDTAWTFDDKRNAFTISTLRAMARGDQIFDSYGRKCNSRFFVNYGFSLDQNEDNQAVIPISIPLSDAQFTMKLRMLGTHPSQARRSFQIPIQYKEKETKEAFSFCRFAYAQDSELMCLQSSEGELKIEDIEPISIRNEVAVLKALSESAAKQLQGFETTVEQDNKLLAEEKLTNNLRNCVVMRRGEKEVLNFYVEMAQKCIPLLQTPWKDLKKIAAKCVDGKGKFDYYITAVIVPLVKSGGLFLCPRIEIRLAIDRNNQTLLQSLASAAFDLKRYLSNVYQNKPK